MFMKNQFGFRGMVVVSLMIVALYSGCSQDDSSAVKTYNNSIVDIQKDMFSKAQEVSTVFQQPNLTSDKIETTLKDVQNSINASHEQFKALKVPKNGERLADAMERFFQVEMNGMQNIIYAVQQLKGKEADPSAQKVFNDTFAEFSNQENRSLKEFYATQQEVAEQFGQKVVQGD